MVALLLVLEAELVCGIGNCVIFMWLVNLEEFFHTATKIASNSLSVCVCVCVLQGGIIIFCLCMCHLQVVAAASQAICLTCSAWMLLLASVGLHGRWRLPSMCLRVTASQTTVPYPCCRCLTFARFSSPIMLRYGSCCARKMVGFYEEVISSLFHSCMWSRLVLFTYAYFTLYIFKVLFTLISTYILHCTL